jgi:hypothetical protein
MNYAIPKTVSEEMVSSLMILGVLYIETKKTKRLNPY